MLDRGVAVGAGTDATRVASYNPWVSLSWLVTGRTIGGLRLYPPANRLSREEALRLWTENNTWFSTEVGKKGQIKARSEEHTSELQSLMRISYAVVCLQKK